MCGIVGLFIKNPTLESQLGELIAPMLSEMTERGPDSAGIAVYRDPNDKGCKITVLAENLDFDWSALEESLKASFALKKIMVTQNHAVLGLFYPPSPPPIPPSPPTNPSFVGDIAENTTVDI